MRERWITAPLADLATFRNGLWKGKKGPFTKAKIIRNTNIRKHGQISLDDVAEIEVEAKQLEKRRLQKGDIILERSGGGPKQAVGRAVCFELDEEDFSFSNFTSFIRVQDKSRLSYRYLHLVLNWWYETGVTEKIQSNSTGIRNLDFNAYKALDVPLPPLEDQQRIVAVLHDAFEGLARARANAEANLQNVRELFERVMAKSLSGVQVGESAECVELKDIVSFYNGDRGKNYPNKSEYVEDGVPWLNTGQIMPDGSLSLRKMNFISREKFDSLGGGKIQPGDLVFCLRGATIGKTAFVSPYEIGAVASSLMIIRPSEAISDK